RFVRRILLGQPMKNSFQEQRAKCFSDRLFVDVVFGAFAKSGLTLPECQECDGKLLEPIHIPQQSPTNRVHNEIANTLGRVCLMTLAATDTAFLLLKSAVQKAKDCQVTTL